MTKTGERAPCFEEVGNFKFQEARQQGCDGRASQRQNDAANRVLKGRRVGEFERKNQDHRNEYAPKMKINSKFDIASPSISPGRQLLQLALFVSDFLAG